MIDKMILGLPAVTGFLYLLTAVAFCVKRQPAWGLTYFSYALANVGLIWASLAAKGTP